MNTAGLTVLPFLSVPSAVSPLLAATGASYKTLHARSDPLPSIAMAAATGPVMESSATATADLDASQAEVVAACLRKMKCLPGSVMDHGPALRGLAAIGRGEAPVADNAPSAMSLVELEAALRDAGSALLEQAGLLAGQRERGGVCAALQYLSFRCFCAVDVLHQAASGVGADAVPVGDTLWGAIVGAWGSVRAGVNVEGALADLTRWWQGFEEGGVDVAGEGGSVTHDAGGEAAADAALAGMRQQAEWLRGEAAGDLKSESAAEHLECAASAVEELHGLLGCAPVMSGRKVKAVGGLDLSGGLECLNCKDVSVYSGRSEIVDEDVDGAGDVEQWSASVDAGARALATSVCAVKRGEAARIARGLPRMAQTPRRAALIHGCIGGRADEPVGERSSVTVQVQCEAGWPLRVFLEDEGWGDVGLEVKQRVAVRVLGVCAVAEACGVSLSGVGVGSFVVVGVGSGSVGDLVSALDEGGVKVVLSACGAVWGTGRADGGSSEGGDVSSVLHEVLDVGGSALGGDSSVVSSFVGSGEGGEHALSSALEVLARGGSGCCMGAYAMACEGSGGGVGRLSGVESAVRSVLGGEHAAGAAGQAQAAQAEAVPATESEIAAEQVKFSEENTTAFVEACKDGKLAKVRELLALTGDETVDVHAERNVEIWPRVCRQGPEAAFRVACANGHLDIVRELLGLTGAREVNVHAADEDGPEAAFRLTCDNGHLDTVRELLGLTGAREVDVHAPDRYGPEAAFQAACVNGHLDIVRELLGLTGARAVDVHAADRHGPEAAFRWACANGHLDIVRELLGLTEARAVDVHAADRDGPEAAFQAACANGHLDIVRELLGLTGARVVDVHAADEVGPEAAFRAACFNGHLDIVRELLGLTGAREVDMHAADEVGPEAAFRAACANGHLDTVRELLGLTGARVVDVHVADRHGPEAAFRAACFKGHTDIVRELLSLTGARAVDVHAAGGHGPEAAFRLTCANGHLDIVRELLGLTGAREVDVHAADEVGPEAAFRAACAKGHLDIVRELLGLTGAREVDVRAADEHGPEAAFRGACRNGHASVVRELLVLTGDRRIPDSVRRGAASFDNLKALDWS